MKSEDLLKGIGVEEDSVLFYRVERFYKAPIGDWFLVWTSGQFHDIGEAIEHYEGLAKDFPAEEYRVVRIKEDSRTTTDLIWPQPTKE